MNDIEFENYKFSYNPNVPIEHTLKMDNWRLSNNDRLGIIPNFNSFYFMDEEQSTYTQITGYASQIGTKLSKGVSLIFDLEEELNGYGDVLADIRSGTYHSLYINTEIKNYNSLEYIKILLWNSTEIFSDQSISREDLIMNDFILKIQLPSESNALKRLEFIPVFREEGEYDNSNEIGISRFETFEWNEEFIEYDDNMNKYMSVVLENDLYVSSPQYEIAYVFNEELQHIEFPGGVNVKSYSEQDTIYGGTAHILQIPYKYINPNNPDEILTYNEGDSILVRYFSPVEKSISMGIGRMYFHKIPHNYKPSVPIAECLFIYSDNKSDYSTFTQDYYYQIPLDLTPFNTEYLNSFMNVKYDINMSLLREFATDGIIKFSDLVISAPYPSYELTIDQLMIVKNARGGSTQSEQLNEKIWRYSGFESYMSSDNVIDDVYNFALPQDIFGGAEWLKYITIYDENYNYYRATTNDNAENYEYQLLWNGTSFSWNPYFERYQDYFGTQIELPAKIDENSELFIEYCTKDSWNLPIRLDYPNVDFDSVEVIYDYDYLLTPRFEEWYGDIYENSNYDYEIVQYYQELFTIYDSTDFYTYTFEMNFSLVKDFTNLDLFRVVGFNVTFGQTIIENDIENYEIEFVPEKKEITITDKNSEDGKLNQFTAISVILNFSAGPISSFSEIKLSEEFNNTYLNRPNATFYDLLSIDFQYAVETGEYLLFADSDTLAAGTIFEPIGYSRNDFLAVDYNLKGYDSGIYITNEVFEDEYNTIYEADLDSDNEIDYKQEIDINRDGKIDITRYGIEDTEYPGQIIWYLIIQDYTSENKLIDKKIGDEKRTQWFDIDDRLFSSYSFDFEAFLEDIWDEIFKPPESIIQEGIRFLMGPVSLLLEGIAKLYVPEMDYWAQKSIQQTTDEISIVKSRYYSLIIDSDLDGYTDKQITYEKEDALVDYTVANIEETILAARKWEFWKELDKAVLKAATSLVEFIWETITNVVTSIFEPESDSMIDASGESKEAFTKAIEEDPVFNDKLTKEDLERGDVSGELRTSFKEYFKTTEMKYRVEQISETYTVQDWEEGEIVETRIYRDDFDSRDFAINKNFMTIIKDIATNQELEIPYYPEFSLSEPSRSGWKPQIWSQDNIPVKYDSLTIITNEQEENKNYYEQTATIIIPGRFSVFHDYLRADDKDAKNGGDVEFTVSGVFMTPPDGMVYYTSDKDDFKSGKAKTKGHYLFYDSDKNSFYDTVYILSPAKFIDGI